MEVYIVSTSSVVKNVCQVFNLSLKAKSPTESSVDQVNYMLLLNV